MKARLLVAILIMVFLAVCCSETSDKRDDASTGENGGSAASSGGVSGNAEGESGTLETGGTDGAGGTQASNESGDGGNGDGGSVAAGTGGTGEGGSSGSAAAGDGGSAGTAGATTETPSVEPDDPLYDRYEGTAFDNACESDEDCMTSGCNGEVCAAESVVTTCEVIGSPGGECGCVDKECIWHENGASLAADPCSSDQGCVTYSDYCEGCNCLALSAEDSPPECDGNIVNCFVDPCMNRSARCVDGSCVLE